MSRSLSAPVVLGLVLSLAAGCGNGNQPNAVAQAPAQQPASAAKPAGGVGVVDLDLVAKRLGRDLEMESLVQERLTTINGKLTNLRNSLRRLYDERKESYGAEPTEEQKKELLAMQDRMEVQLAEARRNGESELVVYKQALVNQFREQAKPVLKEVAADRGLSIVVPKNDGLLLTIDPGAEITDAVADKMLAAQPPKAEKVARAADTPDRTLPPAGN
jgi:Skp family chaperone for outer membrane proteins